MMNKSELIIKSNFTFLIAALFIKSLLKSDRKVDIHISQNKKKILFLTFIESILNTKYMSNFFHKISRIVWLKEFGNESSLNLEAVNELKHVSILILGLSGQVTKQLGPNQIVISCGRESNGSIKLSKHLLEYARRQPNISLYSIKSQNHEELHEISSVSYINDASYTRNLVCLNAHVLRLLTMKTSALAKVVTSSNSVKSKSIVILLLKLYAIRLEKFIVRRKSRKRYEWSIGYLTKQDLIDEKFKIRQIPNPPKKSLADPFVIKFENNSAVFFEEIDLETGIGSISAICLESLENLSVVQVLKEPSHMSFPFVFEYEGSLYMSPETSNTKQIRLYKCVEFPFKWEFSHVLVENITAKDPVIFPERNKWYLLFSSSPLSEKFSGNELYIMESESPISSKWEFCERNPIETNTLKSRNGGHAVFGENRYFIRQLHNATMYGTGVACYELHRENDNFAFYQLFEILISDGINYLNTHHFSANDEFFFFDFKVEKNRKSKQRPIYFDNYSKFKQIENLQ